jgi:cytidylate kinase
MSEVVVLSNQNWKTLNEAFEVLEKVVSTNKNYKYYYNIDANDIILIEISKFDNCRLVNIYLKNGIVVRINEHANSIDVYR